MVNLFQYNTTESKNMIVKGIAHNNPKGYLYLDQKRKLGLVKRMRKQIDKYGLTNNDFQLTE